MRKAGCIASLDELRRDAAQSDHVVVVHTHQVRGGEPGERGAKAAGRPKPHVFLKRPFETLSKFASHPQGKGGVGNRPGRPTRRRGAPPAGLAPRRARTRGRPCRPPRAAVLVLSAERTSDQPGACWTGTAGMPAPEPE